MDHFQELQEKLEQESLDFQDVFQMKYLIILALFQKKVLLPMLNKNLLSFQPLLSKILFSEDNLYKINIFLLSNIHAQKLIYNYLQKEIRQLQEKEELLYQAVKRLGFHTQEHYMLMQIYIYLMIRYQQLILKLPRNCIKTQL